MQKCFLFNLFFFAITYVSYSQSPAQKGAIKGVVLDSASNKPIEFVTVVIMEEGKPIKTSATSANGSFKIDGLPISQYSVVLTYVGYKNKTIDLPEFPESTFLIDLGSTLIASSDNVLSEVEITAVRPIIKNEVDKITYDVEADPESKTMTALDILRKVPLITVDADDNILLKGSGGFKVLVNGKSSSLFVRDPKEVFKSMPASSIKNIEVITTPPAKYDAEGVGGIINIITNRENPGGYNGSVSIGASSPLGINGNAYLTAKIKKFGFSGYYNNSLFTSPANSSNFFRENFALDNSKLNQIGTSKYEGRWENLGGEVSFEIDSLNLLTANYSLYSSKGKNDLRQNVEYLDGENTIVQSYDRINDSEFKWYGSDLGLDYQKTFKRNKDQILTFSYKYNLGGNSNFSDFDIEPILNYEQITSLTSNEGKSNEHTAQVDYVHPFKNFTFEAGLKSILRLNKSDFYYKNYNPETESYEIDESQSNIFEYHQDVYSGYGSVNFKKGKWGFKGGMRVEETKINADFKSSDTTALQDYFNFIPSVTISRSLNDMSSLKLSYNQRLQRPGLWFLNPYTNRTDPKNIYYGNPGLKPSVTNAIDLSYSTFIKGSSINTSLYYNFTDNSIQSFTIVEDSISKTTYRNIGKNKTLGLSINSNIVFSKKLTLNLNGNANYVDFSSSINGRKITNSGITGSLNSYVSYNWGKGWRVGANFGVGLPHVGLQGKSNAYYYNNISINKKLFKDKLNLSASVNNPFEKTRVWRNETTDVNFYQKQESWYQVRRFNFSVNYKFGKLKEGIARKKRGIQNDDVKGRESSGGGGIN
ncbi:MAG TPA: TonB-dependent receptor family protein [Cytophagales bacterium]|nr:TonB-dependent receptor family protein [Cytophagales bacterium]